MQSASIPPVRKSVQVATPLDRAFKIFTVSMHQWWPGSLIERSEREAVVVEPRVGGRWFERGKDGREVDWGRILAWEPPQRVVFGWQIDMDHKFDPTLITEVEVRFTAVGKDATLVLLEHRHLERFGAHADDAFKKFDGPNAWVGILEAFADYGRTI